MKFGEYLSGNKVPEWSADYLDYDLLKNLIKKLESSQMTNVVDTGIGTSLSIPKPTNAAGMPITRQKSDGENRNLHELFFDAIEVEMKKIDLFTNTKVSEIRKKLKNLENEIRILNRKYSEIDENKESVDKRELFRLQVEAISESFLRIEKYVNLNIIGFHKILKKHDRRVYNPCKDFYVTRLHDQSWSRGDYSDVLMSLSRVYASIRGDVLNFININEDNIKSSKENTFVGKSKKFWVKSEDINFVKHYILQYLPIAPLVSHVEGREEKECQYVHNLYLDNYSLELYHKKQLNTHDSCSVRLRWFGESTIDKLYLERRFYKPAVISKDLVNSTDNDSNILETRETERIVINKDLVQPLISGTLDINGSINKLYKEGKTEDELFAWRSLTAEVIQTITSKQLLPTIRTKFQRTLFQIPFDNSIQVTLDVNILMLLERPDKIKIKFIEQYKLDPNLEKTAEISKFPHSVLEVKIEQGEENVFWLKELIDTGKLLEIHKFSKYVHGCATLLSSEVKTLPYWINDDSLKSKDIKEKKSKETEYNHDKLNFLKNSSSKSNIIANSVNRPIILPPNYDNSCDLTLWAPQCYEEEYEENPNLSLLKETPKLYFANERTFLKWLEIAVSLSSMSVGVLAFTKTDPELKAQYFAMSMLPIAFFVIVFSLMIYLWRNKKISLNMSGRWDHPLLPITVMISLIIVLTYQFILQFADHFAAQVEADIENLKHIIMDDAN